MVSSAWSSSCDVGAEHALGQVDDTLDVVAGDVAGGERDGGFDHGQGEALDAEAEEAQVGALGREEFLLDRLRDAIGGQELGEARLRVGVEVLGVPEGVVGVEGDEVKHGGNYRGGDGFWEP